jgi:serine/threonine-protein kinase
MPSDSDPRPTPSAEPAAPDTGDIIAGKYRLVRPIGLGAMGLVFEAMHLRMQQHVAIKFMQPKLVGQKDSVARFEREGRAASRLASPHATRIFDVDSTPDGVPYIVSELLEGRDLRQELDERGKLPIAEAITYVIEACAVMAEAHSLGIVHRDLKPSNLFLAKTSVGRVVKVLDFGISKMDEELELTSTGVMLGSPRYMSPEQVEGKRVDRRADIWALGVILYRAISGEYPFEGTTSISLALSILTQPPRDLVTLLPEAPPGLVAAIRTALTPDLAMRHPTARDFAESLAPFASPEAAALSRTLTRDVHTADPSRPSLSLPTPDTDTLSAGKAAIDALIDISFEPPELATRGTWAEQSAPQKQELRRRSPLGLTLAAGLCAALLISVGAFEFGRYGRSAPLQAGASLGGGAVETRAAAQPPAPPPETAEAPALPDASATSSVGATSATSAPPAASSARSAKSPGAQAPRPAPKAQANPTPPPLAPSPKNPNYL